MIKTFPSQRANVTLSNYRELISIYLPFVIIRCARYTNSRRLAEIIAVYTFISSFYIAGMPEHRGLLWIIIACMTDVVGEDLGNGPDTPVIERLFESGEVFNIARALAGLDAEDCLITTLYYVGRHDLGCIADITGKAVEGIVDIIAKSQRLFLTGLSGRQSQRFDSVGLIRRSMDSLAARFDDEQFARIGDTVMEYLTKQ